MRKLLQRIHWESDLQILNFMDEYKNLWISAETGDVEEDKQI